MSGDAATLLFQAVGHVLVIVLVVQTEVDRPLWSLIVARDKLQTIFFQFAITCQHCVVWVSVS